MGNCRAATRVVRIAAASFHVCSRVVNDSAALAPASAAPLLWLLVRIWWGEGR